MCGPFSPHLGRVFAIILLGLLAACGEDGPDAWARGHEDPAVRRGLEVFARCAACHDLYQPENHVGPHLVDVVGRAAGAVTTFRYSDALANSGLIWTEENLARYLAAPRSFIPGNRMSFAGIRHPDELDAIVAYLVAAGER